MSKLTEMYDVQHSAVGMISAYMHNGSPEFVSLSDSDDKQGYFIVPSEQVTEEKHVKNLIVQKAGILVARRMVSSTPIANGITHLEIGTGVGTGTTASPEVEADTQVSLRVPLARKAIASWTYINPTTGLPQTAESNVIQYAVTFTETEANGALVEMGLFGGDATISVGSGYMFNYKVFPVWNKGNTAQLTIKWNISF